MRSLGSSIVSSGRSATVKTAARTERTMFSTLFPLSLLALLAAQVCVLPTSPRVSRRRSAEVAAGAA